MPQPGEASQPQPSAEDSFLDLLVETLEGVDETVRGQFLRQFFRTIAQVDLTDTQSNEYWSRILARRNELAESLKKKVSLKTAMVDVLASTTFLRVPILMEYDDYKKLQINAATDALTGLYNRRLFDEYFDKELNRAKRYGQHLAVVILDLHKLKDVNDRAGHLQGDQVLQLAATTLRKTLRASDFAFRIGGDEFALLLPQTDPEQAVTLCRRIRTHYEGEIAPLNLPSGVTIDFGVAVFPQDGDEKAALLSLADKKLYELKLAGRAGSAPRHATREAAAHEPASAPAPEISGAYHHEAAPKPGPRIVSTPPQQQTSTSHEAQRPATSHEQSRTTTSHEVSHAATSYEAQRSAASHEAQRSAEPHEPTHPSAPAEPPGATHAEQRKWERVSLAGTKAYAVLGESGQRNAKVLDLSYGGVAVMLDRPEDFPEQFNAVLHVPILPPVRVVLRKAYARMAEGGRVRVGCSFVS
jgi:diguanylate cyclase (GGDEF)-like protein